MCVVFDWLKLDCFLACHSFSSGLRIRIRMYPHYFWKLDPDLHQTESWSQIRIRIKVNIQKLYRAVDVNTGGLEAQNWALEGLYTSGRRFSWLWGREGSGSALKWKARTGSGSALNWCGSATLLFLASMQSLCTGERMSSRCQYFSLYLYRCVPPMIVV